MKTQPKFAALAVTAALLGAAAPALADRQYDDHRDSRGGAQFDYAPVISAEPIVNYVTVSTPVRECWQETQHYRTEHRRRNGGETLVGALIGGVIGHQFGSGRGNDAATVAGTLIGAAIGSDSGRRNDHGRYSEVRSRPVERCQTNYREHQEKRIDGYRVTYRYNGQKYLTEMPYDPGSKIRVRVDVRPAG